MSIYTTMTLEQDNAFLVEIPCSRCHRCGEIGYEVEWVDLSILFRNCAVAGALTLARATGMAGACARIVELETLVEQLRCGDLALFVDGELEAGRAAAFRDHLARCEDCRDGLADNMAIDASMSLAAKPRGRDA